MVDTINALVALATIAFGLLGLMAPRYALEVMDLRPGDTAMGLSEMRASGGGIFVALGLAALALGSPAAYLGLGIAYLGQSIGRGLSVLLDRAPRKAAVALGFEAGFALWLVAANL